tara:strand:+ start:117 stop:1169 length:1053 start_codon:yes stop_codon:yes gene_type:complete
MKINDYNLILGDNTKNLDKMIHYFKTFMKIDDKKYVGIDFEFNRVNNERVIGLFQINLESPNTKTIFMFYPPDLSKKQLKVLKQLLYSENIIIHGGESLDMPYLFSEIFIKNKNIIKFLKNVRDTKFMCESYNYENNYTEYKCKIYFLLLQMKVIDKKQFDFLLKNEEDMGPIYKIFIDVKEMKKELVYYSAYDVLYLPRLIETFPDNNYYNFILPEITNIVIFAKQLNFIDDNLLLLNKFNNFFIIYKGNKLIFNDIYKQISDTINFKNLDKLLSSNYFKKFFQMIFKFIIYIYITNNHEYYINKDAKQNIKLSKLSKYIDIFNDFEYGYDYLLKLNDFINIKIVKDIM